MAPIRVNLGLVHNMRLDLSAFLIGSTSLEIGYSERLGFRLTYLSGLKFEKRLFFLGFLKLDQALSQSVGSLSPYVSNHRFLEEEIKNKTNLLSVCKRYLLPLLSSLPRSSSLEQCGLSGEVVGDQMRRATNLPTCRCILSPHYFTGGEGGGGEEGEGEEEVRCCTPDVATTRCSHVADESTLDP